MRRNVVLVVSGIREGDRLRTTNYELRMKIKLLLLGVLILILASCGSSQRVGKTGAAKSARQLVTLRTSSSVSMITSSLKQRG